MTAKGWNRRLTERLSANHLPLQRDHGGRWNRTNGRGLFLPALRGLLGHLDLALLDPANRFQCSRLDGHSKDALLSVDGRVFVGDAHLSLLRVPPCSLMVGADRKLLGVLRSRGLTP